MLRITLLFFLLVSPTVGCDSEEETDTGTTITSDATAADTASNVEEDVELKNACVGTQPQATAKPFDFQCEGITECTTMPAATDGSCFCAICGVKGIEPACWQAQCPQMGGGGGGGDGTDNTDSTDSTDDMGNADG